MGMITHEVTRMYEIGRKIKAIRERRGMSQKDFSERIGAKVTAVSNWESGLTRPDVDTLSVICNVLNVTPSDLLDVQLRDNALTVHEGEVVKAYRAQPAIQPAVDKLLGIAERAQPASMQAPKAPTPKPPIKLRTPGRSMVVAARADDGKAIKPIEIIPDDESREIVKRMQEEADRNPPEDI